MPTHRLTKYLFPALATVALCATVPFNMGGCAETSAALGGMVGGEKGQAYGHALGQGAEARALGEKDELSMGQAVALQVTNQFHLDADRSLNQYVVLVGLTLANSSSKPDGNWFFAVVDDAQPNAFSGPNGYIFVTTGALKVIRDESELAGVLAHEMTHVLKHHALDAAKSSGTQAAFAEGASTAAQGSNQQASQLAAYFKGATDTVMVKGYGHGQEDESDAGAVKLVAATGYDPAGYLRFLNRIAAAQRQGGTNAAFSTHPDAASRVQKVTAAIANVPKGGATLADRYTRMTASVR